MAFLGMRGTGDWATNQRPENWRETILYLYPNGDMPLVGIQSMMGSESTDDPHYHWFTKALATQGGAAAGVFTDAGLTTPYSGDNQAAGSLVYVQAAEDIISEFKVNHTVKLRQETDHRVDTMSVVTNRVLDGADSYITVKLLENTSATHDLDDVDRVLVAGSAHAEGANMPDSISYDPQEFSNYTQIFRNSLDITRTARKTRLRTGDAYTELKRETLELHGVEMEKSLIHGIKYMEQGSNGKPKRYTQGLISVINEHAPGNVDDFRYNSDYTGKTWLAGGEEWLDEALERAFRYGKSEKLAVCGSTTIRAINQLAKQSGDIDLVPTSTDYGLKVMAWLTPYGTIYLKLHPLFSHEPTDRRSMIIYEPEKVKFRYIDDTFFVDDPEKDSKNNGRDGTKEEFLTEGGWEYHHPQAFSYLTGFGLPNELT